MWWEALDDVSVVGGVGRCECGGRVEYCECGMDVECGLDLVSVMGVGWML